MTAPKRVNDGQVDWGRLVTRCPTGDAHEWDHPPLDHRGGNTWTCQVCGLKHRIDSSD